VVTALYRRYRPESFAEVIGQDHVTVPLMRALRNGRVGHAYLFSGPRGCGKTTSARILARCLNCAQGPTDTPCGECDSCRDLSHNGAGSLDVVEIDAASHGGVDDARELRERATFAPARDRYKVFIIDEAHMVTSAGFNALLKLVEEPPEHVKFVFATTEPDKVIGTIRSRTHHYPFRLIPPQILTPYLQKVCAAEGVQVGEGVLPLVVRAGGGSARDTLSVLDQLIAGAGENGLDHETAINLLGFTDTALLDTAITAIGRRDGAALYGAVEHVLETGHEPRRFVEDLLERLRDLIVLAAVPDRGEELLPETPAEELERMRDQVAMIPPAELSLCGDLVNEALTTMTGATSPRLHLELLAARLLLRGSQVAAPTAQQGAPMQGAGAAPGTAPGGNPGAGGTGSAAGNGDVGPTGNGAPAAGGGSGREEARRIAQQHADAARQARGSRNEQGTGPSRQGSAAPASAPSAAPAPASSAAAAPSAAPAPSAASAPSASSAPGDDWGPVAAIPGAAGSGNPAPQRGQDPSPDRGQDAAAHAGVADLAGATNAAGAAQAPGAGDGSGSGAGAGVGIGEVRSNWSAIVDALQQLRRPVWALVSQHAHVQQINGSTLVVSFRSSGLVNAFQRTNGADPLAQAVRRIMHADVQVEAVVDENPSDDGPAGGHGGGHGPTSGGGPAPQQGQAPQQGGPAPQQAPQSSRVPQQGRAPQQQGQPVRRAPAPRQAHGNDGPDLPPEPDDPYPPDPRDEPASAGAAGPSAYSGPGAAAPAPHDPAALSPTASAPAAPSPGAPSPGAPSPVDAAAPGPASGPASAAGPVDVLEVQDEGRDNLPEDESRTFGQAALRRAIAEDRVVRSIPASPGTGPVAEQAASPAPSASPAPNAPTAPTDVDPASHAQSSGPRFDVDAVEASWNAVPPTASAPATGVAPTTRSAESAPVHPGSADGGRPSGAALAREAARASRGEGQFTRAASPRTATPESAEPTDTPVDDDPTGGASRDDEDAQVTTRTGREVAEAVLGGRVLEVIDETR
jgi:DNA polymerase-3 subunit gamma/tau